MSSRQCAASKLGPEALARAQAMMDGCADAAALAGGYVHRVPSRELPEGLVGWFPAEAGRRHVYVIDELDPVAEAVVVAHEVAHMRDPYLNTSVMASYYAKNTDSCEAVAHYSSWLVADAYGITEMLAPGWFESQIEAHWPLERLLESDSMVHRADLAAIPAMPRESADQLRAVRTQQGRHHSGMTNWQKLAQRMRGLTNPCGHWMPIAKTHCKLPTGHHGSCRSKRW